MASRAGRGPPVGPAACRRRRSRSRFRRGVASAGSANSDVPRKTIRSAQRPPTSLSASASRDGSLLPLDEAHYTMGSQERGGESHGSRETACSNVRRVGRVGHVPVCVQEGGGARPRATVTIDAPAATATQTRSVVTEPRPATRSRCPLTVPGTASVFEATVIVAIESADGSKTFCKTFATASEGAPGRGSFEAATGLPAAVVGRGRPRSRL